MPKILVAVLVGWVGFPSYPEGYARSLETGLPLVVFCGVPPMSIPGTVGAYAASGIEGCRKPGIVCALPRPGGWLQWVATLPPTASAEEIRASFRSPATRSARKETPSAACGT